MAELAEKPSVLEEVWPWNETHYGAAAAPPPVEGVVAQAGPNRVEVVVARALEQVAFAFDQLGVKSPLKEMAGHAVGDDENLTIQAAQALHAPPWVSSR